jgi:hypothetical protein
VAKSKTQSDFFPFVLDELAKLPVTLRSMFGAQALYLHGKIVFIRRIGKNYPEDNGLWVATTPEHHASLHAEFPSLRSIGLFGGSPTTWQNLPLDAPDFEESALRLCAHVRAGDPRIGKVPGVKKKKAKADAPKKGAAKKARSAKAGRSPRPAARKKAARKTRR